MVRAFTRIIPGRAPEKACPVIQKKGEGKMSAHWIIDDQYQGTCTRFKGGKCGLNNAQCHCAGKRDFRPFSILDQNDPEIRRKQYNTRNMYTQSIKRNSNAYD